MGLNRPPANAFRRAARAAVALLPAVVLLAPSGGANGADKRETAQVQLEQLSAHAKETLARQAQLQSTAEEIKADRTELNDLAGGNQPVEADLLAQYRGWAEKTGVMDWDVALPILLEAWQMDNAEG